MKNWYMCTVGESRPGYNTLTEIHGMLSKLCQKFNVIGQLLHNKSITKTSTHLFIDGLKVLDITIGEVVISIKYVSLLHVWSIPPVQPTDCLQNFMDTTWISLHYQMGLVEW